MRKIKNAAAINARFRESIDSCVSVASPEAKIETFGFSFRSASIVGDKLLWAAAGHYFAIDVGPHTHCALGIDVA